MTIQSQFARRAWVALSLTAALAASVILHSKPISAQQLPLSPYTKWLQEEVAYIATFQDLQHFEQLHTDAEREKFIEQFWFIRDPTPGTSENEIKSSTTAASPTPTTASAP